MKKQTENVVTKHPQEPVAPFPYDIENVAYRNDSADIILSATLTKPNGDGPFTTVILIAGMGATNRDGEMYGHKLYFVLADYLTRAGIAVLRFDKRGVGKSTGSFNMNVTSKDLSDDVLAAIAYLKSRTDINHTKIGLIGHSEGGLIASLLATKSPDIAFIVSMAGAVANSPVALSDQIAVQLKLDGASTELIKTMRDANQELLTIIKNESNIELAAQALNKYVNNFLDRLPEHLKIEANKYPFAINPANVVMKLNFLNSPWYRWLLAQDTDQILSQIHVPLLALYGEHDFMAPNLMLPFIHAGIQKGNNQDYTLIALPNLNHAFQTCETGSLAEYGTIEETMAPNAMKIIGDWILARNK